MSAKLIKELRQRTGAGILDCKKALSETDGDLDAAVDWLRQKGVASAAKKAGRIAAEGLVGAFVSADGLAGGLIEINCETDFVALNDEFKGLVEGLAEQVVTDAPPAVRDVDGALVGLPYIKDPSKTVEEAVTAAVAKIGENIQVRRQARHAVEQGTIQSYLHAGGKIGVLVAISSDKDVSGEEAFQTLAKDLAMHVASEGPRFLARTDVSEDDAAAERKVQIARAIEEGKPQNIAEKMVEGRMRKWYEEVVFLEQKFIKDDKKTIQALVDEVAKELGATLAVEGFTRFEVGEGLEKRSDDFAAEVAAAVAAS